MREGAARAARHLCAPFPRISVRASLPAHLCPRISARAHVPSGFAALADGLLE